MATPVALKGHQHLCPMVTGKTPHVGGAINQGDSAFTVNGVPIALVGHGCDCQIAGPDAITQGASGFTVNGVAVALQGSATAHGGSVVQGDASVTVE